LRSVPCHAQCSVPCPAALLRSVVGRSMRVLWHKLSKALPFQLTAEMPQLQDIPLPLEGLPFPPPSAAGDRLLQVGVWGCCCNTGSRPCCEWFVDYPCCMITICLYHSRALAQKRSMHDQPPNHASAAILAIQRPSAIRASSTETQRARSLT